MLSEFELGLEEQLVEVALLLAHLDAVHVVAEAHLVLLRRAPLPPRPREAPAPHLLPLLVPRPARRLVGAALRPPLPRLQRQLQPQAHAAAQQFAGGQFAELEDGGLLGVGEVLEVEVAHGALDDLEGAEEVEQLPEGAALLVVLAELAQDLPQVVEVGLDLLALLQLALEEGGQLLARLALLGLGLPADVVEVAGEGAEGVVEGAAEDLLVPVDDAVRVLDVAEDEPALLPVELVLPAQLLLRAAQRHHVPALAAAAQAHRADQLLGRPAVHRQRLVVLLAGDGHGLLLLLLVEGGAVHAGPALEEGVGRVVGGGLGVGVAGLAGGAGGGEGGPGAGRGAAVRALVRVLVALDAVEADLVAAGGAEQVVGVALAGVAAPAFLHRCYDFIIKIIAPRPRPSPSVIIVFKMSSITREAYPSMARRLALLGARLEAGADYCKRCIALGAPLEELQWGDLEEDIALAYRTMLDLAESLREEWTVTDRLALFLRSLELTNADLVEENRQLLLAAEEGQGQGEEMARLLLQLREKAGEAVRQERARGEQAAAQQEKYCLAKCQLLEDELLAQQQQIEQLQVQKEELASELSLRNTELELAELVLGEARARREEAQLRSPFSQQALSEEGQPSSEKKIMRRHNSLLQDLVQSQLVYQPRLSSQMFKSTETIQQTTEDFRQEVGCLQLGSTRGSKAAWARAEREEAWTQTEGTGWGEWWGRVKERVVTRRIRR